VRTQVDRDLTTVSRVDRLLGLNKNLGRHNSLFNVHVTPIETSRFHKGSFIHPGFLGCLVDQPNWTDL
jgi:hypothetical protein